MDDPVQQDIETRFRLAGLVVPTARKAAAIGAARTMLAMTHWLRRPRTAAAEPSNVFSLVRKEK